MQTRKWTDQSGQDKYTTEIVVDSFNGVMQMIGSAPQAQGNQPQQSRPQQNMPPQAGYGTHSTHSNQSQVEQEKQWDDDIPW